MKIYGTLAGFVIASVAAVGIGAGIETPRSFMTRDDYVSARLTLESQTRLELGQCRVLESPDKSACRSGVRANDRVRKAELEARYRGTVDAESELQAVRARNAARAERARMLADARPSRT